MAGETIVNLVGNLTDDPELRFTPSGAAVANFTVAATPRKFDRQSNEWRDGDPLFLRCSVWRQQAENVAESLRKGHRVLVSGTLKQRSYETSGGEKRTVIEVEAEEVGASLKHSTVKVNKAERGSAAAAPAPRGFGAAPAAAGPYGDDPPF
jgi:single-strand DNA-binding protein